MLNAHMIEDYTDKMRLDIKHPVGTVYFDRLSQVKYVIKYNDGKNIQFFIPETETAFNIPAAELDQAFRYNFLTLVTSMQ
jgi:hypothetical protein